MSAYEHLNEQCERRGWRLALTGNAHFSDGSPAPPHLPAMLVDGLEIRGVKIAGERELLARAPVDGLGSDLGLDHAAVVLAKALERQGLTP